MDNILTSHKRPSSINPFQNRPLRATLWQPNPMVKTIGWDKSPFQGSAGIYRPNSIDEAIGSVVTSLRCYKVTNQKMPAPKGRNIIAYGLNHRNGSKLLMKPCRGDITINR